MANEKIFLSSTYSDLKKERAAIRRALQILSTDIVSMEVFGSDQTEPVELCLSKVRECSCFIGIIAWRYGSIPPGYDSSICELEYEEAIKAGSKIFYYLLDPSASWPMDKVERDRFEELDHFRDRISKEHTVTFFSSVDDLPFLILNDILNKVILPKKEVTKPSIGKLSPVSSMDRPLGMEFFTEDYREFFKGRTGEVDKVIKGVRDEAVSLLIGPSGIGKTSIISAGVTPLLKMLEWNVVYTRPLGDSLNLYCKSLKERLFALNQTSAKSLYEIFSINEATSDVKTLVILDQFEDILRYNDSDIEELVLLLQAVERGTFPKTRVLISYRSDVEGNIGPIMMQLSGSPKGLSRTYVSGLSVDDSADIIHSSLKELGINLDKSSCVALSNTLHTESKRNQYEGIYPPFIQILIFFIYNKFTTTRDISTIVADFKGNPKGIIADYLLSVLEHLPTARDINIKIIVHLASLYGTKEQITFEDLLNKLQINEETLRKALQTLVNARLIRNPNASIYELTHDYLAKIAITQLATEEDVRIKQYESLVRSKTVTYPETGEILTISEYFNVYSIREDLTLNPEEVLFLIASGLSNDLPTNFWLAKYPSVLFHSEALSKIIPDGTHISTLLNQKVYQLFQNSTSQELTINPMLEAFRLIEDHIRKYEFLFEITQTSDTVLADQTDFKNELTGNIGKRKIERINEFINDSGYVPIVTLKESLRLLKSKHSSERLIGTLHLSLYPKADVLQRLRRISSNRKSLRKEVVAANKAILSFAVRSGNLKCLNLEKISKSKDDLNHLARLIAKNDFNNVEQIVDLLILSGSFPIEENRLLGNYLIKLLAQIEAPQEQETLSKLRQHLPLVYATYLASTKQYSLGEFAKILNELPQIYSFDKHLFGYAYYLSNKLAPISIDEASGYSRLLKDPAKISVRGERFFTNDFLCSWIAALVITINAKPQIAIMETLFSMIQHDYFYIRQLALIAFRNLKPIETFSRILEISKMNRVASKSYYGFEERNIELRTLLLLYDQWVYFPKEKLQNWLESLSDEELLNLKNRSEKYTESEYHEDYWGPEIESTLS